MSTAKYASGLANLSAKKEANDVMEETLERDLVFDEKGWQVGGVLAAGAAGAAVGAAMGSVVPIIGTAIGAIVGTAVGGLVALGTDALGENIRDGWGKGSFVDKAIEKTRETGSTSWMDDYSGDEFSADELKKLKENRSAIKQ
jgi:phage tail tape-measure protein